MEPGVASNVNASKHAGKVILGLDSYQSWFCEEMVINC